MLGFVIGMMAGGTVGVTAMCLCTAAKWGDEGIVNMAEHGGGCPHFE